MADQWLDDYDRMVGALPSPSDTAEVLKTAATLYASFKELPGATTEKVDEAAGSVLNEMYNEVKGMAGGRRRTRKGKGKAKKTRKSRR